MVLNEKYEASHFQSMSCDREWNLNVPEDISNKKLMW